MTHSPVGNWFYLLYHSTYEQIFVLLLQMFPKLWGSGPVPPHFFHFSVWFHSLWWIFWVSCISWILNSVIYIAGKFAFNSWGCLFTYLTEKLPICIIIKSLYHFFNTTSSEQEFPYVYIITSTKCCHFKILTMLIGI